MGFQEASWITGAMALAISDYTEYISYNLLAKSLGIHYKSNMIKGKTFDQIKQDLIDIEHLADVHIKLG